jgi:hypothetical protein
MQFIVYDQPGVDVKLCPVSLNPILHPNLPTSKVKVVAIGELYMPLLEAPFKKLGITVIPVPCSGNVAPEIRSHADITFHHAGGNNIILSSEKYSKVQKRLDKISSLTGYSNWNVIPSRANLNPKYPGDIALNALRIGKYLFCNAKHTDVRLLEHCEKSGIEIVNVNQGYAKCSVCVVKEDAAITSDPNLAEEMFQKDINVLLIEPGYIELDGYEYGFVGGASGKISSDTLCFTGSLKSHPSIVAIDDFLERHGVIKIELTDKDCFDIGSIIPLLEVGGLTEDSN